MSAFNTYGVCPCGWYANAPFGNLFHIHREVCPQCGTSKRHWREVVGRPVNDGSWLRPRWRLEEKPEEKP